MAGGTVKRLEPSHSTQSPIDINVTQYDSWQHCLCSGCQPRLLARFHDVTQTVGPPRDIGDFPVLESLGLLLPFFGPLSRAAVSSAKIGMPVRNWLRPGKRGSSRFDAGLLVPTTSRFWLNGSCESRPGAKPATVSQRYRSAYSRDFANPQLSQRARFMDRPRRVGFCPCSPALSLD